MGWRQQARGMMEFASILRTLITPSCLPHANPRAISNGESQSCCQGRQRAEKVTPSRSGVALNRAATFAYVCLSKNNTLAIVDLSTGKMTAQIPVGVCPYGIVLSPDESTAYVTDFGGRHPAPGAATMPSSGTAVAVDKRGIPLGGTVSVVDLKAEKLIRQIDVGLHPCQAIVSRDGQKLFVANANSDSVSVVDLAAGHVVETIGVRPDAGLPVGSIPNALALSKDEKTLYCACGGNNAIAVISLGSPSHVDGFIPTGWFPGAVACEGNTPLCGERKRHRLARY